MKRKRIKVLLFALASLNLNQQGLAFSQVATTRTLKRNKKLTETESQQAKRQENEIDQKEASSSNSNNLPVHTLLLCRHGDSIWNGGEPGISEMFTGWTDVPLSSKGIGEAKRLGQELVQRWGSEIDACFTSTLQRAQMTANYCCFAFAEAPLGKEIGQFVIDFRLNERHYGTLQGYSKQDVQDGKFGHGSSTVQLWRRSWHACPPLLSPDDPRRKKELIRFINICGGDEQNVPRGESLSQVAKNRIEPFVHQVMVPTLNKKNASGGTGLIVAHANSLRALIGVLCNVEDDPVALKSLESLRIPTGVPLVLKYQLLPDGGICVCNLNGKPYTPKRINNRGGTTTTRKKKQQEEEESALSSELQDDLNHEQQPDLPVWPLSCIPIEALIR